MTQAHELPVLNAWYWDVDHKERFEIIALDDDDSIEIQYFEGEIEEIDKETWFSMRLVPIAPPKDWSGPYEVDMDRDEFFEYKTEVHHPTEGHNPLDSIE